MRLNKYQWDSTGRGKPPSTGGVQAEMIRGGVTVKVTVGSTYIGRDLTTDQTEDLAAFLLDAVREERGVVYSPSAQADAIDAAADWLEALREHMWNGNERRPNNYGRAAKDLRRYAQNIREGKSHE